MIICFTTEFQLAFSNCGPYNMLSEESVEDLNTKLENPVLVKNFRPNIVIKGCKAYEEVTCKNNFFCKKKQQ